tara:strand:- start:23 stop:1012 length:990 start_codon:yes stop_codon:yes gene_type:complete
METKEEGKATIRVDAGKISKKLPVFYNPVMELNRTLSVELLRALPNKQMRIGLPLAGSGVRGIRFLKELPKSKLKEVVMNDYDKEAVKRIKYHLKKNKVKAEVHNEEANQFLLSQPMFDYLDIDPFGFPGTFLDAAVKRIKHKGILAITATDTAALCGTYPKACKRKYWATPVRDELMHERGLRILIRRVQLVGISEEKALTPLLSYAKDHYMRVFFRCERGKEACDAILKQHGMWDEAGPLWMGNLEDVALLKKMKHPFSKVLAEEAAIPGIGFIQVHKLCKKLHKEVPRFATLIEKIHKKKHKVSRTHFSPLGLKTTLPEKEFIKLL